MAGFAKWAGRQPCGGSLDELSHGGGDKEDEACSTECLGDFLEHRQCDACLSLVSEERHARDENGKHQDGTASDQITSRAKPRDFSFCRSSEARRSMW